ncbi:MAG: PqqD family peptide modification chaperone [Rhodobiaceae bacterium]|nr:PqqD family peptide modification chaperone [Rhodobiaceae bacterium]MCC0053098.1 PqqD family peptide modification chaperone [Rhodobiaceae bacterium]
MIDDVGETYRCNNTLTELLKELDGERSIIEISHRLRNKYNCIDDMIVKDLRNVASDLCEIGILESV